MDRTWTITIQVKVTTLSGWEPDSEDIQQWLDEGGTLKLVRIERSVPKLDLPPATH